MIKGELGVFGVDVKRLRVPFAFEYTCSKCGSVHLWDMSKNDYLNYPDANKYEELEVECWDCGEPIRFKVKLNVSISVEGSAVREVSNG